MGLPKLNSNPTINYCLYGQGVLLALAFVSMLGINLVRSWGIWWLLFIIFSCIEGGVAAEIGKAKVDALKQRAKDMLDQDRGN